MVQTAQTKKKIIEAKKSSPKQLSSKDLEFHKGRREALVSGLDDADRRFNIAISRMSEITNRVQELEVQRNKALRKQFLAIEIKKNPKNVEELKKEFDSIQADNRDIKIYEEVSIGYRSMSTRKNSLEEERNIYVKDIEDEDKKIAKLLENL